MVVSSRGLRRARQATATITESECTCGTISDIHQGILLGAPGASASTLCRRAIREFITHYHRKRNDQGQGLSVASARGSMPPKRVTGRLRIHQRTVVPIRHRADLFTVNRAFHFRIADPPNDAPPEFALIESRTVDRTHFTLGARSYGPFPIALIAPHPSADGLVVLLAIL